MTTENLLSFRMSPEAALRLMLRAKTLAASFAVMRACMPPSEHARIDAWHARVKTIPSDRSGSTEDVTTLARGALSVADEVRSWFLTMGVD
ncbi:MAG: hypothetical protein ACI9W2_001569 [Gammaproteobacteria bacterium]|jgi:hypothetical protein